jgi:hypothetical protein
MIFKKYVYLYIIYSNLYHHEGGGWIVKAFGCDKEGEISNPNHEHVVIMTYDNNIIGSSNYDSQSTQDKTFFCLKSRV